MQTLDAPVFEVKQSSDWYKKKIKNEDDQIKFFKKFEEVYGSAEGFAFWHSEYFGVESDTECYEIFKNDLCKNPKDGYYPFKKRSENYKKIKAMLEQIEEINPFKAYDVFGLNNVKANQWIGERWFFGVKDGEKVSSDEVAKIDYKKYLQLLLEKLD